MHFPTQWVALFRSHLWNPTYLLIISVGRYLLIPLLVLCVSPSPSQPLLPLPSNFILAIVLILIVGFTTGYFGTLPMVLAPKMVDSEHREIVGESLREHTETYISTHFLYNKSKLLQLARLKVCIATQN